VTSICGCGKPADGAFICPSCCKALQIALGNISTYWADLDTVKARLTRYGGSGGGRGGEKPLPVDARFLGWEADGSRLQDAAKNTIATWTRVVLDERHILAGPTHDACLHVSCSITRRSRPPRDDVVSCCRYLLGHADWIRTKDWAPEILDELDDLEAQLRRMVDRPADKWFAGPCDGCERDLYAKVGAKTVDCADCDRSYDIEARRAALLAEAEDYLANATELARAVSWLGSEPLTAARIWKWAERGRITAKQHVEIRGKQVPQYRIGDALDLLANDTTKKAG
jgi:hypothetical protein